MRTRTSRINRFTSGRSVGARTLSIAGGGYTFPVGNGPSVPVSPTSYSAKSHSLNCLTGTEAAGSVRQSPSSSQGAALRTKVPNCQHRHVKI